MNGNLSDWEFRIVNGVIEISFNNGQWNIDDITRFNDLVEAKDRMVLVEETPTYPEIMKKAAQGAIDNGFNWVAKSGNEENKIAYVEVFENKPFFDTDNLMYKSNPYSSECSTVQDKYYPTLKEGECLNLHEIVKE